MVEWLFLVVPWGCLRFVIVVFPNHTHLLFKSKLYIKNRTLLVLNLYFMEYHNTFSENKTKSALSVCFVSLYRGLLLVTFPRRTE